MNCSEGGMNRFQKRLVSVSALLLAIAVALGAFGAHALTPHMDEHAISIYKTANFYHFVHALGILSLSALFRKVHTSLLRLVFYLLLTGIVLFSGSLYTMASLPLLLNKDLSFLGMITPLGGLAFIAGWLVLAVRMVWKKSEYKTHNNQEE